MITVTRLSNTWLILQTPQLTPSVFHQGQPILNHVVEVNKGSSLISTEMKCLNDCQGLRTSCTGTRQELIYCMITICRVQLALHQVHNLSVDAQSFKHINNHEGQDHSVVY